MKKNIIMVIFALLLAIFICGSVSAAEWNVTPGNSIQSTIDMANDNDTIFVHDDNGDPYTYCENVMVNKTNLTLKAVGSVTVNNTDLNQPSFKIDYLGSYSTIEGFYISGFSINHNIIIDGATNCNIIRNSFQGTALSGIEITNSQSNNIFENYLENAEIRLDSSNNNNISKNTGNSSPILIYGSYYNIIEENNLNNSYINLGWAYFNTISKNNLTNISGVNPGISLWRSQNNQIHDNILTGADNCENSGIIFGSSPDNTLSNNKIENFKYNFGFANADDEVAWDENYYENIDTTNTINGKPIYFLRGNNSQVFDGTEVGYLGLLGCYDLEIKNISISNNLEGLLLVNTHNTIIENCNFSNNKNGVYLLKSYNNTICNSIIGFNTYSGTRFIESNGNTLLNNNFDNCMYGFLSSQSKNNTISHNTFQSNDIYMNYAYGFNEISNNHFYNGSISLNFCTVGTTITGNIFDNNGDCSGISIYDSPGTILRDNNITNYNITNLNGNHNLFVSSFENSGYEQDIDTSNLINGKPIYYLVGQNNLSFDGIIMGYLALISCNNIHLRNLVLDQMNGEGILAVYTNNTDIENSTIKNNGYAMLIRDCNNISVNSSSIIDNSEGIRLLGNSTLNIHFCRMKLKPEVFTNYNIQIEDLTVSVEAENNWWGSNDDLRIYNDGGYIDYDPWLVMTFNADPTFIPIFGTSNLTVNFTTNSDGQDTSSQGQLPDGIPVTFTTTIGNVGSKSVDKLTSNGVAQAILTADLEDGIANLSAIADRQFVYNKVDIYPIADIYITKSAIPDLVVSGEDTVTFQILVGNNGPSIAHEVILNDYPDDFSKLDNLEYSWDHFFWDVWSGSLLIGDIASGANQTVWIRGLVRTDAIGIINNTANVTTSTTDIYLENNTANSITHIASPGMVVNNRTWDIFTSIQEGIDDIDTLNGDTIYVCTGTFIENLVLGKNLNLKALGNVIIERSVNGTPVITIPNEGSDSNLEGFTIGGDSSSAGILLDSANNCTVINNTITGQGIGILVMGNQNHIISNNVNNNGWAGICLSGVSSNTVNNNIVSGNPEGIYILNCYNSSLNGNFVDGNIVNGLNIVGGSLNTIINNTISNNGLSTNGNGIILKDTTFNNLDGNVVSNNGWSGVVLDNSSQNYLLDSGLGGNIIYSNGNGIVLFNGCNNNSLMGNNFYYNLYNGLELFVNCQFNLVSNNNFVGTGVTGLLVQYSNNNNITLNTVSNSNFNGVALESANNTIIDANNITGSGSIGLIMVSSNSNQITANELLSTFWTNIAMDQSSYNLIQGNTINGTGVSDNGIWFQSNCNWNNITSNIITENRANGLFIQSSNNNLVNYNNISQNSGGAGMGLLLVASTSTVINHNTFQDNGWVGTCVSSDSNGNTITENNYISTTSQVSQAYDAGTNNYDNGSTGNYWNNWTSTDPRPIDGGAGNIDNHPSLTIF